MRKGLNRANAPSLLALAVTGLMGVLVPAHAAPAISLKVLPASVAEGNSGTQMLDFAVTLSTASKTAVTVNYSTVNGTAIAGSDYRAISGKLSIPAGQKTALIRVPVNGDTQREANETLSLKLSAPVGCTIELPDVIGLIYNEDDYYWQPGRPVQLYGNNAREVIRVAMDDAGNAVALWNQDTSIAANLAQRRSVVSRYVPGKGWGEEIVVSSGAAPVSNVTYDPNLSLAMAPTGQALATWGLVGRPSHTAAVFNTQEYDVAAATYHPASGWGNAQILSLGQRGGQQQPVAAMSRSGKGSVGWTGANPLFSVYEPSTGWSAPQALSELGGTLVGVGSDDAGNFQYWWQASSADRAQYGAGLLSRLRHADGSLGPVEAVSTLYSGFYVATAMAPDGTAYAAWFASSVPGGTMVESKHSLFVAQRPAGGRWSTPSFVQSVPFSFGGSSSTSLQLAASKAGALMTWTSDYPSTTQFSRYVPGTGWSSPQHLIASGLAVQPEIALAANGEAIAVYTNRVGTVPQVFSTQFKPAQGWSTPMQLQAPRGSTRKADVAMSADGRATAVYTATDSTPAFDTYWMVSGNRFE